MPFHLRNQLPHLLPLLVFSALAHAAPDGTDGRGAARHAICH